MYSRGHAKQQPFYIKKHGYFTGNQVQTETPLGGGYFIDHLSGMTGYRHDDDEEIEWQRWGGGLKPQRKHTIIRKSVRLNS